MNLKDRQFVITVEGRSGDTDVYGPFASEQAATDALENILTRDHGITTDQVTTDSEELWEETGVSFLITTLIPA
jgi:hypothetical protein